MTAVPQARISTISGAAAALRSGERTSVSLVQAALTAAERYDEAVLSVGDAFQQGTGWHLRAPDPLAVCAAQVPAADEPTDGA